VINPLPEKDAIERDLNEGPVLIFPEFKIPFFPNSGPPYLLLKKASNK